MKSPETGTEPTGQHPALTSVQERFRAVNGDHPMSDSDETYVRERYVAAPAAEYADMLAGRRPLPSYLLNDGTPMVPADRGQVIEWAGGLDRLPDWFASHWPDDAETAAAEWTAYLSGQYVCLPTPGPREIRAKRRWTAQIEQGRALLDADPHDITGRSLVGEAAVKLDPLLAPMCDYDRLRFGGPDTPLSRERWIDRPREWLVTEPPELPLRTERLVLRACRVDDAETAHRYYGDPEVARYLLGPAMTLRETEHMMRQRIDEVAPRAAGDALLLQVEFEGRVVGDVMLQLLDPALVTAEVGWTIDPAVGGRGIATEAASALIDLGFEHYRLHRVHADLDARNDASRRLCERLGMRQELDGREDYWSKGHWTPTLRFSLLRTEWAATPH